MADFDLIVIGAGPGGYVAAIRASQLGMKVACIEKEKTLGGTCLNIGCIPSKALLNSSEKFAEISKHAEEHGISTGKVSLDLAKLMQRKNKIVKQLTSGIGFLFKKNKITHIQGAASFLDTKTIKVSSSDGDKNYSAKNYIIATGSTSISIDAIPIDEKQIVTSTGALALESVPKSLLVIGGGYIGLEMGSVWNRLGSKVTVVEALDRIVPTMDEEIATEFMKSLKKQGLEFKLSHKVISTTASKSGVEVSMESSDKKQITEKYDVVLMSVGRKPNTEGLNLEGIGVKLNEKKSIEINSKFKTNINGIFAIGDVVPGPMLAHKASSEGHVFAEQLLGNKPEVNYQCIPAVVYTEPEVAWVGPTERELESKKIAFKKGIFPFSANARGKTTGDTVGSIKFLSDKDNDKVLAVHIIGAHAGELIGEAVAAIEAGLTAEDISLICHAHPTLSESMKEAASLSSIGKTLHF